MSSSAIPGWGIIRRADAKDAEALAAFARKAFTDTFASANSESDMSAYLGQAFGAEIQRGEIASSRNMIFVAEREGEIIGYLMMRAVSPPPCVEDRSALEIVRLYVSKTLIGGGVGSRLMQQAVDETRAHGKRTIWLGVWEHNPAAISFYTRWGYVKCGDHTFTLGSDRQTDQVMVLAVDKR